MVEKYNIETLFYKTWKAFIFLQCKKINAKKRFGKKEMGFAVAIGYGGIGWVTGKEPIRQKVFPSSQVQLLSA